MNNIINLSIYSHADRAEVAAEGNQFTVVNNYAGGLKGQAVILVSAMDADTLEAFKKVLDYVTYEFEATYNVIKVAYANRFFNLAKSYVRSAVSTAAPAAVPAGTTVTVRFEFPGFKLNDVAQAAFVFGSGFSAPDVAALAASGVTVVNGTDAFTVTANSRECKVYFVQPSGTTGNYVIDYPAIETVIQRL